MWKHGKTSTLREGLFLALLQGGPGSSSMFGALKLHGAVLTTVDENDNLSGVASNPNSWAKKHNMIYIDNPVGAGGG